MLVKFSKNTTSKSGRNYAFVTVHTTVEHPTYGSIPKQFTGIFETAKAWDFEKGHELADLKVQPITLSNGGYSCLEVTDQETGEVTTTDIRHLEIVL